MAPKKGMTATPRAEFEGWDKFSEAEQQTITEESTTVLTGLDSIGKSNANIGRALVRIRTIMLPKKLYLKYLKYKFHMSRATAYRYTDEYELGVKHLPEPILEGALARNIPLREETIKANPAPRTTNPVEIATYLDRLEATPRPRVEQSVDPETMKKEVLNFFVTRFQKLHGNEDFKTDWVESLVGMILSRVGVTRKRSFQPVAVPASFIAKRGRPSKPKELAAAA